MFFPGKRNLVALSSFFTGSLLTQSEAVFRNILSIGHTETIYRCPLILHTDRTAGTIPVQKQGNRARHT